jgi:hypothetical protein
LKEISTDRPKGVLANVLPSSEHSETTSRVELFARDHEKIFGILRILFVAYAFEGSLLHMADLSGNVVQVRTLGSHDGSPCILQDLLVLKRGDQQEQNRKELSYYVITPSVFVPALWGERMKLKAGDKIVVSRPVGEFTLPPPTVSEQGN